MALPQIKLTREVGKETEEYVADTPILATQLVAAGWTRVSDKDDKADDDSAAVEPADGKAEEASRPAAATGSRGKTASK